LKKQKKVCIYSLSNRIIVSLININILDIDIPVRSPSPYNHYYAINEENGNESTLKLEASPNTPLKSGESPSRAKITQKRIFKSFRKL
jgi:hypothetical protein